MMTDARKVMVIGAGGRVGLALLGALARQGVALCAVDRLDEAALTSRVNRAVIDAGLGGGSTQAELTRPTAPTIRGAVDVLNVGQLASIIAQEAPHLVVNYAIPFTWDAARNLPNYPAISGAGLGAFAPTQLLAPRAIGEAITASGVQAKFIVGNLPDITVPVLHGMATHLPIASPVGGAGNVGLIANALTLCIARDLDVPLDAVDVALCAHHVHWVVPREPGYPNDAPFFLQALCNGQEITEQLGDAREYMNRSINRCYEPGAGFSSTTGLLAAELASSLLAPEGNTTFLHMPAPNGLPGGYPVRVSDGKIELALPSGWSVTDTIHGMEQAHRRDGIDRIEADGTVYFNAESVAIMRKELGIELPLTMPPEDLEEVALEQIRSAVAAVSQAAVS